MASVPLRYDLYQTMTTGEYSEEAMFFQKKVLVLYGSADGRLDKAVFESTSIPDILLFLKISHHYYLNKLVPEIEQSLGYALALVNGGDELWVHLSLFFMDYKTRLLEHIAEEEQVYFPILQKLYELDTEPLNTADIRDFIAQENLFFITDHHDAIEDELAEIIHIINLYVEEVNQSMPLRIFVSQINRFEMELRNHAILEDLLLLPMAKRLEARLRGALA